MADRPIYFNSMMVDVPANARLDPMRLLYFKWLDTLNPCNFEILVEDLSGEWRSLGKLRRFCKVPDIFFPAYARILIRGTNSKGTQLRFLSQMSPGSTYVLNRDEGNGTEVFTLPSSVSKSCCSLIPG